MALEDARFDPAEFDEWSTRAITASSSGGNEFGQKEIQALWGKGPKFVGAYQSIAWFYAATTGQISIKHGIKGPCGVVIAEGAGGLEALQHTRRTIRRGVDTVISGGCEAPIGPYALTCQLGNGYLSQATAPEAPTGRSTRRANGYVPGEGGAIILVESLVRAQRARGAPHLRRDRRLRRDERRLPLQPRRPRMDASSRARSPSPCRMRASAPDDVDAVFADGFGVPEFDAIEAGAIKSALGERRRRGAGDRAQVDGRAPVRRRRRRSMWRPPRWRCATA